MWLVGSVLLSRSVLVEMGHRHSAWSVGSGDLDGRAWICDHDLWNLLCTPPSRLKEAKQSTSILTGKTGETRQRSSKRGKRRTEAKDERRERTTIVFVYSIQRSWNRDRDCNLAASYYNGSLSLSLSLSLSHIILNDIPT